MKELDKKALDNLTKAAKAKMSKKPSKVEVEVEAEYEDEGPKKGKEEPEMAPLPKLFHALACLLEDK